MSPKIFSYKEKEKLKIKMFEAGLELLKEYGMTHMSVEKITVAAGIGKSTFYNFFSSKEAFVYELVEYERDTFWRYFDSTLAGREKMTQEEGEELLKKIIFSSNSVYQYLTPEDEAKLCAALPEEMTADIGEETKILEAIFSHVENVRENLDYPVIANLLKIMAMAAEGKKLLHEEGYIRTQEKIFELLFNCVFEKR